MELPRDVVIVSNSPIFASALKRWLEPGSGDARCRILAAAESAPPGAFPRDAVLLLAPQDWKEMARWLRCLGERAASHPWLLLADLRLAGLFSSFFEPPLCTLVAPGASPDALRLALCVLGQRQVLFSPNALLGRVADKAPALPGGSKMCVTRKELQCACAIALGLTNRQIAETLHIGYGTVKCHVAHLMRKFQVTDRAELGSHFDRVLSSVSRF